MQEKIRILAEIVLKMDNHLRTELLKKDTNMLWENTYIKRQIDKRKQGGTFSVQDHICAMVYSMLSAGITWERVNGKIDNETKRIIPIDDIFCQYAPQQILQFSPNQLRDKIKELHFASQYTLKQMQALLSVNIPKLLQWEKEYGTVDTYYQKYIQEDASLKLLVKTLSDSKSKNKLAQMEIALVSEYLRNVGYDIPKPDRHTRRILGNEILGLSEKQIAEPFEVFDILQDVAEKMGKSVAEVDYILWSYCANGYGEICTVNQPKCGECVVKGYCNKSEK